MSINTGIADSFCYRVHYLNNNYTNACTGYVPVPPTPHFFAGARAAADVPKLVATLADTNTMGGHFVGDICASATINGEPVATIGSTFFCPGGSDHAPGVYVVLTGVEFTALCVKPVAVVGSILSCNAAHTIVVTSQTHFLAG
jgi:uncharacterized Zn-binding protein involved in type VI secretion